MKAKNAIIVVGQTGCPIAEWSYDYSAKRWRGLCDYFDECREHYGLFPFWAEVRDDAWLVRFRANFVPIQGY